jgi:hypothetical protein
MRRQKTKRRRTRRRRKRKRRVGGGENGPRSSMKSHADKPSIVMERVFSPNFSTLQEFIPGTLHFPVFIDCSLM